MDDDDDDEDDCCFRCGRAGHYASECYARTDVDGVAIGTGRGQWTSAPQQLGATVGGVVCYRCGRPGHKSTECYARSHVNGHRLS
jgi:hypothetical protein